MQRTANKLSLHTVHTNTGVWAASAACWVAIRLAVVRLAAAQLAAAQLEAQYVAALLAMARLAVARMAAAWLVCSAHLLAVQFPARCGAAAQLVAAVLAASWRRHPVRRMAHNWHEALMTTQATEPAVWLACGGIAAAQGANSANVRADHSRITRQPINSKQVSGAGVTHLQADNSDEEDRIAGDDRFEEAHNYLVLMIDTRRVLLRGRISLRAP